MVEAVPPVVFIARWNATQPALSISAGDQIAVVVVEAVKDLREGEKE